jgi:hypothetical protein
MSVAQLCAAGNFLRPDNPRLGRHRPLGGFSGVLFVTGFLFRRTPGIIHLVHHAERWCKFYATFSVPQAFRMIKSFFILLSAPLLECINLNYEGQSDSEAIGRSMGSRY